MESFMTSILSLPLLLAAILLWRCQQRGGPNQAATSLVRLDELTRLVECSVREFRASINKLDRRLEVLEMARATKQESAGLVELPPLPAEEHLQAAALLLADGYAAERVAAVLALPVGQVEWLEELRKYSLQAHAVPASPASVGVSKNLTRREKKKLPSSETRKRVRPILLTDIVCLDGAHSTKGEAA